MTFASHYIERHSIFDPQIEKPPSNELGIVVVIPCFNEPNIIETLDCLRSCDSPHCDVEVIVMINSGEFDKQEAIDQNRKTEIAITDWSNKHSTSKLKFFAIQKKGLPGKHAGAGLARKIGMDEATFRFNSIENPNGIIVSLDADARCSRNYLSQIYQAFKTRPKAKACTIYFEHPLEGNEFSAVIYEAISTYELYLRYYNQALRYTGYPYAFHGVGSCFAVRAGVYAAQGGMNRKQAGEDFYFLQKVIPLGGFFELNSTCVIPSPRPSNRVPFGTGPMVKSLVDSKEGIQTYPVELFECLRIFFADIFKLFKKSSSDVENYQSSQIELLRTFLQQNKFVEGMSEINSNSTDIEKFMKRFYRWFNAFRILKLLNYACDNGFQKEETHPDISTTPFSC